MESCLLCLEINNDIYDSVKASSGQWQQLHVEKTIEKHFWSLNNIQPSSWICLPCWQEVDNFHKFYLRIEEAHMNFGKIKVEDVNQVLESKEEIVNKNLAYYLEPELLIEQKELQFLEDIPNEYIAGSTDPLSKSKETKNKNAKSSKIKCSSETKQTEFDSNEHISEVKLEPKDYSDNNSDNVSYDEDNDGNNESDKTLPDNKSRKESDKFILEHFKQMFCDCCEVPFKNFADMKRHFAISHSNPKGYLVCCNRKFYHRYRLEDHLHHHLNPDYFKCAQCGKVLSDRKSLKIHMLRIHRPHDVALKHSCDICGKSFIMAKVLRTHKLTHLSKEEKKFPCNQCGKFYASSYLLKMHTEVIHLNKQAKVCHICGKTLRTSTEYKAHMDKHNVINGALINCDVCGLRLTSERSLKLHKESQHPVGGKKDHPCPMCNRVSPTARALKKHIITMHEKGYDHKCNMCEKAFRRPEGLKEHVASQHTGTALYTCPWCPKTFNSNGNMHAHRKKMHPKEWMELKLQKYS